MYRLAYGKYLCRVWNSPGYKPEDRDLGQLLSMELVWHSEPIIWNETVDGTGKKTGKMDDMKSISLWNHSCFRKKKTKTKTKAVEEPKKMQGVEKTKQASVAGTPSHKQAVKISPSEQAAGTLKQALEKSKKKQAVETLEKKKVVEKSGKKDAAAD